MPQSQFTIHCNEIASLPQALSDMADDIAHRVVGVQRESRQPWHFIRIEVWEDSGRIVGFPACEPLTERSDATQTQIVCNELRVRVAALDKSGLSDAAHEEHVRQLIDLIATGVRHAWRAEQRFKFKVFNQDGDELVA
jgi:hypothetical protein